MGTAINLSDRALLAPRVSEERRKDSAFRERVEAALLVLLHLEPDPGKRKAFIAGIRFAIAAIKREA